MQPTVSGTPAISGLASGVTVCLLPDHGLIGVTGPDALSFLHAQLTNDVEHLAAGAAQFNGYCSPKGRLLATFLQWHEEAGVRLALDAALVDPIRARLSMFVLRAKVRVEDETSRRVALGLMGADLADALAELGLSVPSPMSVTGSPANALAIGLPAVALGDVTLARVMVWVPPGQLDETMAALLRHGALAGAGQWRLGEVLAGHPRVLSATSGAFVPQMINFELVGGVSFTKGCYPGQEVVARSQYLGKLKRRMFLAACPSQPLPGSDVSSPDSDEAVGMVVMSAPHPDGDWRVLFECTTAAAEADGLSLADGAPLHLLPLPYPIPAAPGA